MTAPVPRTTPAPYDVDAVRAQFPILAREVNGHPLVYLDNAATTQKPRAVLDAMTGYYTTHNANVHRGVHRLSQEATIAFEGARASVARYLNAPSPSQIVFTRGATEAINLIANTYGARFQRGDEVVLSQMEHHSNIVPWQMVRDRTGSTLFVAPINDRGELNLSALDALIGPKTRLVCLVHVSNTLGTVNPAKLVVELAHSKGVPVLLDGAQALAHTQVDVQDLDVDFYVTSAHKVYGPTGIGAVYIHERHLGSLPPWQGGGDMILSVSFEKTTYNVAPHRFEAGTPHIDGAIGFGAALDWLHALGVDRVAAHEESLRAHATEQMARIPGLHILGTAEHKAGVISFVMEGVHPHDIGTIVDQKGVAVRTGHHCTQPLMARLGVSATARASFAAYNTHAEVDALIAALHDVRKVFA